MAKITASMLLERTRTGYVLTAQVGNCFYQIPYTDLAAAEQQIATQLALTPQATVARR